MIIKGACLTVLEWTEMSLINANTLSNMLLKLLLRLSTVRRCNVVKHRNKNLS